MVLARRGRAVSPVTSYLAIEPGVRPSTEGLEERRARVCPDVIAGAAGVRGPGGTAGTSGAPRAWFSRPRSPRSSTYRPSSSPERTRSSRIASRKRRGASISRPSSINPGPGGPWSFRRPPTRRLEPQRDRSRRTDEGKTRPKETPARWSGRHFEPYLMRSGAQWARFSADRRTRSGRTVACLHSNRTPRNPPRHVSRRRQQSRRRGRRLGSLGSTSRNAVSTSILNPPQMVELKPITRGLVTEPTRGYELAGSPS